MDLADLTYEKAKRLAGTAFEVALRDGETTTLVLDDVEGSAAPPAGQPRAPFSLYFLGDASLLLPQGTYALRSENVSWAGVFIVPIAQDERGTRYQAVFS